MGINTTGRNRYPRERNWRCPGCKEWLDMPPLVAVTHSSLLLLPDFRDGLRRCARILLAAGADPNQSWKHGEHPLSALYGAAGKNHDPETKRLLLDAGADPNDGESLYHSVVILRYAKSVSDQDLIWAIRRARNREHVAPLPEAGANPRAHT